MRLQRKLLVLANFKEEKMLVVSEKINDKGNLKWNYHRIYEDILKKQCLFDRVIVPTIITVLVKTVESLVY